MGSTSSDSVGVHVIVITLEGVTISKILRIRKTCTINIKCEKSNQIAAQSKGQKNQLLKYTAKCKGNIKI
jgi:hypothetical protein